MLSLISGLRPLFHDFRLSNLVSQPRHRYLNLRRMEIEICAASSNHSKDDFIERSMIPVIQKY